MCSKEEEGGNEFREFPTNTKGGKARLKGVELKRVSKAKTKKVPMEKRHIGELRGKKSYPDMERKTERRSGETRCDWEELAEKRSQKGRPERIKSLRRLGKINEYLFGRN